MNVSLTPELELLINKKVATGMYHSASEVIREALRLLNEHDALRKIHHEELRREIAIGMNEIKQGKMAPLDIETIKAKGSKLLTQRRKVA